MTLTPAEKETLRKLVEEIRGTLEISRKAIPEIETMLTELTALPVSEQKERMATPEMNTKVMSLLGVMTVQQEKMRRLILKTTPWTPGNIRVPNQTSSFMKKLLTNMEARTKTLASLAEMTMSREDSNEVKTDAGR